MVNGRVIWGGKEDGARIRREILKEMEVFGNGRMER